MNSFIQFLKTQLLSSNCYLCHRPAELMLGICEQCVSELPLNHSACSICATPINRDLDDSLVCGKCQKKPPHFDHTFSPFLYQKDIISLIHQLKYHDKLFVARSLGTLFSKELKKKYHNNFSVFPEYILPVPLHKNKLKLRGYNQATELAKIIAQDLMLPFDITSIVRDKETLSQRGLNSTSRQQNVKSAFAINKSKQRQFTTMCHVAILDDVLTTGSTVNSLAKLLKEIGVERVDVWTIARA